MKSRHNAGQSRVVLQRSLAIAASLFLLLTLSRASSLFGQTITLDFRFDSNGTPAMSLVPGSAGQTFTVDVFATIKGDVAHTDATQYGLQTAFYRGRSDQSGGGAFTTGGFVAGSFVGTGQFGQSGNATAPSNVADNGSTTDGVNLNTTADGIIDFGATANNGAKESSTISYVYNNTASQAGFVAAANGGMQFEIAQFKFTTGTATTGGKISKFWPTVPGATSTEAQYTQDHGTTNTILGNTLTQNPLFVIGTPLTFTVAAPAGQAADDSDHPNTYGPPLTTPVATGASYAGIDSKVTSLVNSPGGSTAFPPAGVGNEATILAGTKSAAVTSPSVNMSWRTRLVGNQTNGLLDETHGDGGSALQAVHTTTGLVSDVLNLTGLETGSPNAGSTDPFVLQMSYNPALLPKHGTPAIEQGLAANKLIYMVSPLPGPDDGHSQYAQTDALNTGNVVNSPLSPDYGAVSSWSAYAMAKFGTTNPTAVQLASDMGAWGVDLNAHAVWNIVDHNSTFAVVPEPATILLAGLGLLGLFGLRRAENA